MNDRVTDLLQVAGVPLHERAASRVPSGEIDDDLDRLLATAEIWMGVSDDDCDNDFSSSCDSIPYIEDSSPLSEDVIYKLSELIIYSFRHLTDDPASNAGEASTGSAPSLASASLSPWLHDPFLDVLSRNPYSADPSKPITLERMYLPVRMSRWLRHLMELTIDPQYSLSQRLLQLQPPSQSVAVLQAFYHHLHDLPRLQAQLYRYTHSLQQSKSKPSAASTTTTTEIAEPTRRLQEYATAASHAQRLNDEYQVHLDRMLMILGEFYRAAQPPLRAKQRHLLGLLWRQYSLDEQAASKPTSFSAPASSSLRVENTRAAAIDLSLRLLHRILLGIPQADNESPNPGTTHILPPSYEHLLFSLLLPLHQSNSLVLWRDQTPVLELYHPSLSQCVAALLQHEPSWLPNTVLGLVHKNVFPTAGVTGKQVLLLHEIDSLLGLFQNRVSALLPASGAQSPPLALASWFPELLAVLARCMGSDHSRVAERALAYFKNRVFVELLQMDLETSLRTIVPTLIPRNGEPSWNPTVRKMTFHVLKQLQQVDATVFARVCNQLFGESVARTTEEPHGSPTGETSRLIASSSEEANAAPRDFSLKAGMGTWRPPSASIATSTGGQQQSSRSLMPPPSTNRPPTANRSSLGRPTATPPLTVTGVAPWAVPGSQPVNPPSTVTGVAPWVMQSSSAKPPATPPVTITGVAPWASKPTSTLAPHKRRAQEAHLGGAIESSKGTDVAPRERGEGIGLALVLAYIKKLQPPEEVEGGTSSWSKAQMAESPTLLPHLKFHDLVFGHQDLGKGSFGSVRYARLVDRNTTRSSWAEYAVKVISTEKIRELGYEASVQREIAVLRVLSHPGIARLVSSFRFQEGAYLVLEYASGGDLHTLLRKHGSLDHDSTRFVVGELVAALASIHDLGLVYSDLKTENILITETGHIKLTDFGACRPVTLESKDRIRSISKDVLRNLRDGGWKPQKAPGNSTGALESPAGNDALDDFRIEGTTAYLPPEVVLGSLPTFVADSWALGCVTYQCLSGRPPFLEGDDESTKQRIVSFGNELDVPAVSDPVEALFKETHASSIRVTARDMIRWLLQKQPSNRPTMQQVAEHEFFTEGNVDVFSLYRQAAYPLDVGKVAPAPEAQWSRRQYSSIWAPQPEAYDLSIASAETDQKARLTSLNGTSPTVPIPEGEEGRSFFSATAGNRANKLSFIDEPAASDSKPSVHCVF